MISIGLKDLGDMACTCNIACGLLLQNSSQCNNLEYSIGMEPELTEILIPL